MPKYHQISMAQIMKVDFVNLSSLLCQTPFYTQIRAWEPCGVINSLIGDRGECLPVIETTGENLDGNRSGNRESTGISKRESGISTGISKRESRNDRGESNTVIETTGENLNGNRESKTGIERPIKTSKSLVFSQKSWAKTHQNRSKSMVFSQKS